MNTKITIKDIAKKAGVSVATVSYVLNNRTEERISEETRKKVLQIVNLLNYTPNQSARALATSSGQSVALYLNPSVPALRRAQQMLFVDALSLTLHNENLNLVIKSKDFLERLDGVDAIICLDLPKDLFLGIGDKNFIPLVAVDCIIDDPLFFQITSDYQKIKTQADAYFGEENYLFACLDGANLLLKNRIQTIFPAVTFINSYEDFENLHAPNLLITAETLDELKNPFVQKKLFLNQLSSQKVTQLMECIHLAKQRVKIENHDIIV